MGMVKQLRKAARIILVGAPGVGKGTQTQRLIHRYPSLSAISSGDLLRDNVRNKTPLGLKTQAIIQSGNLVPDHVMLDLISHEFSSRGWLSTTAGSNPKLNPAASFILDGFPRTAAQACALDTLVPINLVVHLITPPSIIVSRIASRWVHEPSGRVYNTDFNPPKVPGKDDVTGKPLTQRKDDSFETWTQRLKMFDETSKSLLDHYEKEGCLERVEGNSSNEISPKLFAEIEKRFA